MEAIFQVKNGQNNFIIHSESAVVTLGAATISKFCTNEIIAILPQC